MSEREKEETLEVLRHIERHLGQIAALLTKLLADSTPPPATYMRPVGLRYLPR